MNTAQIEMTDQQEQKLESAIIALAHREVIRMNTRNIYTYRVRKIEIREIKTGDIALIMEFDNGKPGTLGYIRYSYIQVFIGKRGGYSSYNKEAKRIRGWKALYQVKHH